MTDDEKAGCAMAAIGLIVGLMIGVGIGKWLESELRNDAIKHHAAEWQINPETGDTKFVWKGADSP